MEKTGRKRPWKSLRDFHFSHSFNNNKLDDRDHFLQNAKTSVASLRRLITPTRNADHDQPGTLITFIGIRTIEATGMPSFSILQAAFPDALQGQPSCMKKKDGAGRCRVNAHLGSASSVVYHLKKARSFHQGNSNRLSFSILQPETNPCPVFTRRLPLHTKIRP